MSRRSRGFSKERELARILWRKGFAVLRAPASGSRTRRLAYPDLVALRNGYILVFEVKTREKPGTIYIDRRQFMKLMEFVRRSGGSGYVAVKILDGRGWRFIPIERVEGTRGGNYRVSLEAIENGLRIDDLVRMTERNRVITEFI